MTVFQAILLSIFNSISEILPLGSLTHQKYIPFLLKWQAAPPALIAATSSGVLLALLVYFRHDWICYLSSLIKVLAFRTQPRTMDEKLPFFLILTVIPVFFIGHLFMEPLSAIPWSAPLSAALLILLCLPLWFAERISKRKKFLCDLNWMDALFFSLGILLALPPVGERAIGVLCMTYLKHYRRDAAIKILMISALPVLGYQTILHLKPLDFSLPEAAQYFPWSTFFVALFFAFLSAFLALMGFFRKLDQPGHSRTITYRILLAITILVFYWIRR